MALSLFPARAPIGRTTTGVDVMMTPEFSRSLSSVFDRIGGSNAPNVAELVKELARRPSTLAQAAEPAELRTKLDPVVLASVVIPAGAMGPNGMVRVTSTWSMTNSQKDKTVIIRFGGVDISSNSVTTATTYQEQRIIQNRNTPKAQVFVFGGNAYTGAPIGTLDRDTTQTQRIDIVGQLSDSQDTMTLEAYTVELIPSP